MWIRSTSCPVLSLPYDSEREGAHARAQLSGLYAHNKAKADRGLKIEAYHTGDSE